MVNAYWLWENPPWLCRQVVQGFFSGVSVGWMSDIVKECQCFDQVLVESQRAADRAGDGSDFVRVGQPRAMIISHVTGEDLHFAAEAPKGGAVNNPIAIALKRTPIGMVWLRVSAALRIGAVHRVGREQERFAFRDGLQTGDVRQVESILRSRWQALPLSAPRAFGTVGSLAVDDFSGLVRYGSIGSFGSRDSPSPAGDVIRIRGARVHNLQNVDLDIPRDQLVVITGPSGSGKSSLALDTVFAEGQRQYIETLSVYARQFFHQWERPDVDLGRGARADHLH